MRAIERFFEFWLGGLITLVMWSLPTGAVMGLLMPVSLGNEGTASGDMNPLELMFGGGCAMVFLGCCLALLFGLGGLLSPGRLGQEGLAAMIRQCRQSCATVLVALSLFLGPAFLLLGLLARRDAPWRYLATGLFIALMLHLLVGVPLGLIKSVRSMNEPKPQAERKPAPPIAAP